MPGTTGLLPSRVLPRSGGFVHRVPERAGSGPWKVPKKSRGRDPGRANGVAD